MPLARECRSVAICARSDPAQGAASCRNWVVADSVNRPPLFFVVPAAFTRNCRSPPPGTIPAPTRGSAAPTDGRAEERTIPAPTRGSAAPTSPAAVPTGGCAIERAVPTPTSPTGGCADSRSRHHRTANEGTMERDVAMVSATPTEIGTDAEGAPHMAAMHACKRHRRAGSANDGVGLGNCRRDAVKSEGQRSEEQRRCDENLLHESSSMDCNVDPAWDHSTGMFSSKFSSRWVAHSGRKVPKPKDGWEVSKNSNAFEKLELSRASRSANGSPKTTYAANKIGRPPQTKLADSIGRIGAGRPGYKSPRRGVSGRRRNKRHGQARGQGRLVNTRGESCR